MAVIARSVSDEAISGKNKDCFATLLRNKIFDSCPTLMAARHSGQGRRPRPGIQEQKTGFPPEPVLSEVEGRE
jgi:hypothetical protein